MIPVLKNFFKWYILPETNTSSEGARKRSAPEGVGQSPAKKALECSDASNDEATSQRAFTQQGSNLEEFSNKHLEPDSEKDSRDNWENNEKIPSLKELCRLTTLERREIEYYFSLSASCASQVEREANVRNPISTRSNIKCLDDLNLGEREDFMPQLSKQEEKIIDLAFIPGPSTDVLASAFKLMLTRRDMATLKPYQWLNDNVINFYMNLVMERGKRENYPSVHAFNTFFFSKLMSGGHAELARWTKRVDIFAFDILLIPVHLGAHWCMAIVDVPKKAITYYDSMGGRNYEALEKILDYLIVESRDKKKEEFDATGWKLTIAKNIPHQKNGSDCGIFACQFAETVSCRRKITFTQAHMPDLRRRMAYELLTQQLVPTGTSNRPMPECSPDAVSCWLREVESRSFGSTPTTDLH